MNDYQIRILSGGRTQAIIETTHLNDHAAVRAAQKYAAGKQFEVWRGLDCVYDASGAPNASGVSPSP